MTLELLRVNSAIPEQGKTGNLHPILLHRYRIPTGFDPTVLRLLICTEI